MTEAKIAELVAKYKGLIEPSGLFTVEKIDVAAYEVKGHAGRGHPFMIGPKHVAFASDNRGGMLTSEAIDASGAGCYWQENGRGPKCNLPHANHTTEYGLFVKLTRDLGNKEANDVFLAIKPHMMADKIKGVALVNLCTKGEPKAGQFRIAKPTAEQLNAGQDSV